MEIFAGNMLDDRAITGRKNTWEAAEDDDEGWFSANIVTN